MDIIKDVLAALSGVLNGLPQGLLAMAFGFAAFAFIVKAAGNAAMGSVAVISYQAETITGAGTMGKNLRERLSMIFFGAFIMLVIGLFGLLEKIIEWIGPVITSGMMAGVGLTLTKVAWDMAKGDKAVGITSFASGLIVYMATVDLVYTITVSVLLSSAAAYMINKRKGMTQQPVQRENYKAKADIESYGHTRSLRNGVS